MDKLKPYAAPLIALVILVAWFFVIRPMLAEQPADEAPAGDATGSSESPDAGAEAETGAAAKVR